MTPLVVVSHGFQSHYEASFCNGLAANGAAVTLLGSCETLLTKLRPEVEFINIRGEQRANRPRWRKAANMLAYHAKLLRYVCAHRHRTVMIIGLLNPPWLIGIVETALLRVVSRRLTLTVHNVLPHGAHNGWMRALYWVIYRIPHVLIAHTESAKQSLVHGFGVPASRVTVMQHGSNDVVEACTVPRSVLRQEAAIPEGRTVLLFFGVASHYKGLDILLNVALGDPRIHVLFGGRCPNTDYGHGVRGQLERLRQQGRLTFHEGFVPDNLVGRLFRLADAVVLPYRHIDQSGVLLLALALGVPVIATDVGEFRALLDEGTGIIADGPNVAALRAAINLFIADRGCFESAAIRERARRYAWPETVKPVLEVIT